MLRRIARTTLCPARSAAESGVGSGDVAARVRRSGAGGAAAIGSACDDVTHHDGATMMITGKARRSRLGRSTASSSGSVKSSSYGSEPRRAAMTDTLTMANATRARKGMVTTPPSAVQIIGRARHADGARHHAAEHVGLLVQVVVQRQEHAGHRQRQHVSVHSRSRRRMPTGMRMASGYIRMRWYQHSTHGTQPSTSLIYRLPHVAIQAASSAT